MTLDDLESSCSLRAPFPEQTLQSMFDDYKCFVASRGDIRKVKIFNNCKGEPLFADPGKYSDWSIHFHAFLKVCLPELHISMGIFYKLYSLLEEECRLLDFKAQLAAIYKYRTNNGILCRVCNCIEGADCTQGATGSVTS